MLSGLNGSSAMGMELLGNGGRQGSQGVPGRKVTSRICPCALCAYISISVVLYDDRETEGALWSIRARPGFLMDGNTVAMAIIGGRVWLCWHASGGVPWRLLNGGFEMVVVYRVVP